MATEGQVTLKIRMTEAQYLALRFTANKNHRSMNGEVNFLLDNHISSSCAEEKAETSGHEGVNND